MATKYKWLSEQLREMIQEYIQKGVNKLPTEQELSSRYHVSRQTVRSALASLEEKKEIRRIKGSGTYITGLSCQEDRNVIGILIPDEQQYQYPAFLSDFCTALAAEGFTCKVFQTHNHSYQERQLLQFLLKQPLRALLAEPVKSALPTLNTELYQNLLRAGTSVLFLGCAYPGLPQIPVIYENNLHGARLLVQNLVEKGHTSIAGLFQMDDIRGHERFQGFLEAMQNYGLSVPDQNICWFTTRELTAFQQNQDVCFLQDFLKQTTADCTAFVCHDDFIAWLLWREFSGGLSQTAFHASTSIPALAAFNTSYLTTSGLLQAITLTTPAHQPGTLAAQILLDKLKGLPVSSQEVPLQLMLPHMKSDIL